MRPDKGLELANYVSDTMWNKIWSRNIHFDENILFHVEF